MAKYYNKSKGPLAVVLKGGNSVAIPGKSWIRIPTDQESSADLHRYVKKGFLVRSSAEDPKPSKQPVVAQVTESPKVEVAAVVSSVVEAPLAKPSKSSKKSALVKLQPKADNELQSDTPFSTEEASLTNNEKPLEDERKKS